MHAAKDKLLLYAPGFGSMTWLLVHNRGCNICRISYSYL